MRFLILLFTTTIYFTISISYAENCTTDIDRLETVYLKGESHNNEATEYWKSLINSKGDYIDCMMEGACVDSRQQSNIFFRRDFPDQIIKYEIHPTEDPTNYFLGLLVKTFDEISRVENIRFEIAKMAELQIFDNEAIRKYTSESDSEALKFFINNNGIEVVQSQIVSATFQPQVFQSNFDNIMFQHFDTLMTYSNFIDAVERSIDDFAKIYVFPNLPETLSAQLLLQLHPYLQTDFISSYQKISIAANRSLGIDILDFIRDFTIFYTEQNSILKQSELLEMKSFFQGNIQNPSLSDNLSQKIANIRNDTIAQSVYNLYCERIANSNLKPIYVRVGSAHLDDLEIKLNALFEGNVSIEKSSIN